MNEKLNNYKKFLKCVLGHIFVI